MTNNIDNNQLYLNPFINNNNPNNNMIYPPFIPWNNNNINNNNIPIFNNNNHHNNFNFNNNIIIRIDNLPPNKSWKDVKYLIGGIIHHTNILKVFLLPPLTSIIPPFLTFNSCIVFLKKKNLNWDQINRLINILNNFQWDLYQLYVFQFIPNTINQSQNQNQFFINTPPNTNINNNNINNNNNIQKKQLSSNTTSTSISSSTSPDTHNTDINLIAQPNKRRLRQIFNEKNFRKQMTNRNMYQLLLENFPPFLILDSLSSDFTSLRDKNINNQRKNLIQFLDINNESDINTIHIENPNKFQSKLRWSILKDYIKLKCPTLLNYVSSSPSMSDTKKLREIEEFYVGVYEDHEEIMKIIYSKDTNDNTDSKDAIDDNTTTSESINDSMPSSEINSQFDIGITVRVVGDDNKLHDIDSDSNSISNTNNNDSNEDPFKTKYINAIVSKAIIGFHSKDLKDLALSALNNQEYSLNYKLKITELPPWKEDEKL